MKAIHNLSVKGLAAVFDKSVGVGDVPRRGPSAPVEVDCREVLGAEPGQLTPEQQRVRELLDACREDPARFQTEVLGRDLWRKQVDVCNAMARSQVTLVPAGRAVGKSFLLAGTVLWWLYTRPNSLVITTGPDHRQVVSVLWKEIRRALRPRRDADSRDPDQDRPRLTLGYDHVTAGYNSPQRLCVKHGSDWGALGFAAQYEEGFSGQHAGDLLVIVDEASGVTAPIWSAIHGLAATRYVVCGNPIRYDCHFRELHDIAVKGSPTMTSVSISSLESPDARKDFSPVGMASRSFLNQMREIHGEESPWWRSNLTHHGLQDAVGYFGAGKGGKLHTNRRTANAFAVKRRLDPHREGYVPLYCGALKDWSGLRDELAELRCPAMEVEEGKVKQVLEEKDALAARLHRSPDLLDAFLMTFTYSD